MNVLVCVTVWMYNGSRLHYTTSQEGIPYTPTLPTLGFGVLNSISENFFVDSENVIFSRGEGLVKILEVLEV